MSLMLGRKWNQPLAKMIRATGLRPSASASASAAETLDGTSFADHRTAYGHLSNIEVLRGWLVLKLCSMDFLVQNSIRLLERGERVLGRRFLETLLKPTLYRHFVAGDTPQSMMETTCRLKKLGVQLMALPSLEEDIGQAGQDRNFKYDSNLETALKLAELTGEHGGPLSCMHMKITALIPADLLMKIGERNASNPTQLRATVQQWATYLTGGSLGHVNGLSPTEKVNLERGLERLKSVGRTAVEQRLRFLVDGEYTYLNPAISVAALSMSAAFNSERPVVWNTYQCYLRDAYDKVTSEFDLLRELGVCFGAKIVRGAYLDRERHLAVQGNYADPTNPNFEATSDMYHRVMDYLLEQTGRDGKRCHVLVGSHNEESILKAVAAMRRWNIQPSDNTVVFGQIYGMASNITIKLASQGYTVYNSVPYGNLFDVLPYLSRRAAENRAVLEGTRRERTLLTRELRARAFGF